MEAVIAYLQGCMKNLSGVVTFASRQKVPFLFSIVLLIVHSIKQGSPLMLHLTPSKCLSSMMSVVMSAWVPGVIVTLRVPSDMLKQTKQNIHTVNKLLD